MILAVFVCDTEFLMGDNFAALHCFCCFKKKNKTHGLDLLSAVNVLILGILPKAKAEGKKKKRLLLVVFKQVDGEGALRYQGLPLIVGNF